jgi:DNA repair exonuclease SbcCD ATPase subunit
MSEDAANPFVLRVEISAEQVPRLREALSANGADGELARRATDVTAREERLRFEQAELEERARRLTEREAELGSSDELTASERIRLAQRRQSLHESESELETREHELLEREAEFEADVLWREERMERWRAELSALEEELERRERDLAEYVAQLQGAVNGNGTFPPGPGVAELRRTA